MSVISPPARVLRDYQVEAVQAVINDWAESTRRVGVVLPTGAGKSTVIAALAAASVRLDLRVVLLAHRAELLDQMALAVAAVDPELPPVGIVRAHKDDHDAPIVAATLQTLVNPKRRLALGERHVILWDEVHHIGAATWHQVLVDLGGYEGAFMCGFTATMRREDGKRLGEVIEKISYERDLRWAIEQGFLSRPRGLTVRIPDLDLASVKTVAGDFQNNELAEVMEASTETVVEAIENFAPGRRCIVFAAGVDAAHALASGLRQRGSAAEAVDGSMHPDSREPIYQRFRDGETTHLVTVQILTEGADFPMCDAAVIARPTKSQVLYSQMVGRALRLYPGKEDALVLDLTGTTRVLKLVTLTDLDAGVESKAVELDGTEIDGWDDPLDTEAADSAPPDKLRREGPVDMIEIDLLSSESTGVLWFQTVTGIPFMQPSASSSTRFYPYDDAELPDAQRISYGPSEVVAFLWRDDDDPDLWQAGWMTMKGSKIGGWIQEAPSGVLIASGAAEDWMVEAFGKLPLRRASWRDSQPPSSAQLNLARMIGIPDTEHMTKARLSDEISIKLVSRRLKR
jgi:superfamily II DNA or RNA helicase